MGEHQEQDRLFVGEKKVLCYNTNSEGDIEFELQDGSSDTITADQFWAVAKPSRYDDGMVRVYKWNKAISEIVGILLKNKMKLIEKDFVSSRVDETIIQAYQRAAAKLFGAKFEDFINLAQIDSVLKEHNSMFIEENAVEEVASDVADESVESPAEEAAPEAE